MDSPIQFLTILLLLLIPNPSGGQDPVDLFPDSPALSRGFIRLAAWNVRHLNVDSGSEDYFAGNNRQEDLAILTASFAKAVIDLKLDLVIFIEVQPRVGDPNLLDQIRQSIRDCDCKDWQSDITQIEYDDPNDPYGNLQFGLLWNPARGVQVDRAKNSVLEELRQPRSSTGELLRRDQRAPWLIPVVAQTSESKRLEFDLLALHLKSGGSAPQAAEVEAITRFVRRHQTADQPRHLILCGDWNIRPDEEEQGRGRPRLRKMTIPDGNRSLLRLLTVGDIGPSLDEWEQISERIGAISRFPAIGRILPYSHIDLRKQAYDTLLDHMAISRTLDEVFDHPVKVLLANGEEDLRPGIEIVQPLVPHSSYVHFTDHLPVVLTLRVDSVTNERSAPRVQIAAIEPNPIEDERQFEKVFLRNRTAAAIDLRGWRIQNSAGKSWTLDSGDYNQAHGRLPRGRTATIRRRDRPMTLNNSGDTITLFDSENNLVDTAIYGPANTGEMIWFE